MTFGEKLQKLRRDSGLSQEKLAEQLHVSRQAVSKWELGTAAPDTDNIVRLSKFFQVPLEYLMLEDCLDPAQVAGKPQAPAPEPAEKPPRWRKWLPLWLLMAGVALEALAYGLCYPMQERSLRLHGEFFTNPSEYLFHLPLGWLTVAGAACLTMALWLLWRRK